MKEFNRLPLLLILIFAIGILGGVFIKNKIDDKYINNDLELTVYQVDIKNRLLAEYVRRLEIDICKFDKQVEPRDLFLLDYALNYQDEMPIKAYAITALANSTNYKKECENILMKFINNSKDELLKIKAEKGLKKLSTIYRG